MAERIHPLTILIYFLSAALIPVFSGYPVLLLISLLLSVFTYFICNSGNFSRKGALSYFLCFMIIAFINPLLYHDGNTVLFYINGLRITLEALIYGLNASIMVVSVLIWFKSMSMLLTSDKVLCLFSGISPKISIILSMSLNFIPRFSAHAREMRANQKLLGSYGSGTFIEKLKAEGRIFSGMMTWALEHSMVTSDSMASRGFGVKRRTTYRLWNLVTYDILIILFNLCCLGYTIFCILSDSFETIYYPDFVLPVFSGKMFFALAGYCLMALTLPAALIIPQQLYKKVK